MNGGLEETSLLSHTLVPKYINYMWMIDARIAVTCPYYRIIIATMGADRISLSFARRQSRFACVRVCGRLRANDYAYTSDRDVTSGGRDCVRQKHVYRAERRATWGTHAAHGRGMEKICCAVSRFLPASPRASLSLSTTHSFPPSLYLLQPTIACIICPSRRGVDKSKRRPRHVPITSPLSFTSSNSPPRDLPTSVYISLIQRSRWLVMDHSLSWYFFFSRLYYSGGKPRTGFPLEKPLQLRTNCQCQIGPSPRVVSVLRKHGGVRPESSYCNAKV